MAGSWNHTVEKSTGKLLADRDIQGMLECHSGDVSEYAEEVYGMVWWMATVFANAIGGPLTPEGIIEDARQNYRKGLEFSPGRAREGVLEDGEEGVLAEQAPSVPRLPNLLPRFEWGTIVVVAAPGATPRLAKVVGNSRKPNIQYVTHWVEERDRPGHWRWSYGRDGYHLHFMRLANDDEIPAGAE